MKKLYSIIIVAGLVICMALNLYNRFVLAPQAAVTFEIHPLSIVCGFVTTPLSWVFIGMIFVVLIFRDRRGVPGRKRDTVLMLIGVLILIVFWVTIALPYAGISVSYAYLIPACMTSHPVVFLIPGIFIGVKLWNMVK